MVINVSAKWFSCSDKIMEEIGKDSFQKMNLPEQVKALKRILPLIEDPDECKRFMEIIKASVLFSIWQKKLSENEIKAITPHQLWLFWNLSRKKIVVAKLQILIWEYYESLSEEEKTDLNLAGINKSLYIRKQIRATYKKFEGEENEITNVLFQRYKLPFEVVQFIQTFRWESDYQDTLYDIAWEDWDSLDRFFSLNEWTPYLWVNTGLIKRELAYDFTQWTNQITWNYLDKPKNEDEMDARNGFINPNWFLNDIDIETAIKLWWLEKTKYIFWNYFFDWLKRCWIKNPLKFPGFYNLWIFRIKIDEDSEGNKKKLIEMAQHIYEWEINELSQNDFWKLIEELKRIISDFKFSGGLKKFDHPIQTNVGNKQYQWFFSWSKWFENTHIIDIQPQEKNWKRVLRFATDLGQDTVLYILLQISYFIQNKDFIPHNELWREIYQIYNNLSLEWVETFSPHTMAQQYDTLVRKVIWPLSREHKEKKKTIWKPHNVIIYWVYGTGKSQLLTHLISERKYILPNWETIHLEANVININIMEFADLLLKSSSSFRKRLSDIHENTWRPIILVIEDIDTIIKENWLESDPVSQALTIIFEGVWSLPITVVASTNNPEILPQRHLRPNRFDTPIWFQYPIDKQILENIFKTHWEKKWLDKLLQWSISIEEIIENIQEIISKYTPSHIAALCLEIQEEFEFLDISQLTSKEILAKIIWCSKKILVPIQDMTQREESMKKWIASLWSDKPNIWFRK